MPGLGAFFSFPSCHAASTASSGKCPLPLFSPSRRRERAVLKICNGSVPFWPTAPRSGRRLFFLFHISPSPSPSTNSEHHDPRRFLFFPRSDCGAITDTIALPFFVFFPNSRLFPPFFFFTGKAFLFLYVFDHVSRRTPASWYIFFLPQLFFLFFSLHLDCRDERAVKLITPSFLLPRRAVKHRSRSVGQPLLSRTALRLSFPSPSRHRGDKNSSNLTATPPFPFPNSTKENCRSFFVPPLSPARGFCFSFATTQNVVKIVKKLNQPVAWRGTIVTGRKGRPLFFFLLSPLFLSPTIMVAECR